MTDSQSRDDLVKPRVVHEKLDSDQYSPTSRNDTEIIFAERPSKKALGENVTQTY